MPLRLPLAAALLAAIACAAPAAAEDRLRTERVQFAPGAESAVVAGRITGAGSVDYLIGARAGQTAEIVLSSAWPHPYFNLLRPDGETVFVGASEGDRFEGRLDASGDWTIRVYQMGQARDGGETHGYSLEVRIAAGGGAGGLPARLIRACADAARAYFGDPAAPVDLRYSEPRVDGTETVGGEVSLAAREAYVACAFAPGGGRMTEFFVDGEDRIDAVAGAPAGPAPVAPEEGGSRRWQVTARGGLRMHEAPAVASRVIVTLPEGAILSNLGCAPAEGRVWCDVQPFRGGARGYVAAEFLAPAPGAQGSAPPMGEDDSAQRAGRGEFDATAPYTLCSRGGAPVEAVCEAGVARGGGGDATVVVTFPDGVRRALFFTHGEFIGADASQAGGGFDTDWSKDAGGTYRIRVDGERYEIPEALIFGG